MESVNNILEDKSVPGTEKLEKINLLLDIKLEGDKKNINTNIIYNITTENIELKYDVLRKVLITASNFEENIEHFISYFTKACTDLENHKLLAKLLIFIFEIRKEPDQVQQILSKLGTENINKVLLSDIFFHKRYKDADSLFKAYLKYLSTNDQSTFLSNVFEHTKVKQNVELFYLALQNINKNALILDKSILRTEELWLYLTKCLVNYTEHQDIKIVIFILQFCINFAKNENLDFNFLSVDGDENAWNAFFALAQIFAYKRRELMMPSLQLISYVSSLHYFWQHHVYKLLLKRVPSHLKCTVLVSILKQKTGNKDLTKFCKLIFSAVNERRCDNKDCPVFTELRNFCEKTNIENFSTILDEVLYVSWNNQLAWTILENVLVDSKKNLVDFKYFSRILRHLESYKFLASPYCNMEQIATFFCEPENFNFWNQIRSSRSFSKLELPIPEKFKNMALSKLIELSNENCDDLLKIETYLCFLRDSISLTDIIKDYLVGIHIRIVIYKQLFTMSKHQIAETKLHREKVFNDFLEYFLKHLNEKNYVGYKELMINYFQLDEIFGAFGYPKDLEDEFERLSLKPELYTKYQIYCTLEIMSTTDLFGPSCDYYNIYATKWKDFILETDDSEICKQGLFYVLQKGGLNIKEYNEEVEKLLKKHFCDNVSEEIYSRYLNADLMDFAYQHLIAIMKHDPKKYKQFSKLFCQEISRKFVTSEQFSYDSEAYRFCCFSSKYLEYFIREIDLDYTSMSDYLARREKIMDLTIEIYLNKLSKLETKMYCLHILMKIVSKFRYDQRWSSPLRFFTEDIQWIMTRLENKYAVNLENNINRLRSVQGLFLLVPYVLCDLTGEIFKNVENQNDETIHKELKNILKRIAEIILVTESDGKNNAARQICQHMYILLCEHNVTYKDIRYLLEKVKEQSSLACSFMPILYHLMPFCKFSTNEVEEIFEYLFLLSQTSDDKLRSYTQILLQRVHILYNNNEFKNIIEQYASRLEEINLDINKDKNQFADILKTDYLFLKAFDPVRDRSLETVLYIFPKLNKVDSSEWEGIMKLDLIWNSDINRYISKNDQNDLFKKSVEEFLEPQEYLNKYINYSVEDILEMFKVPSKNLD